MEARQLRTRREPFSIESLMGRVKEGNPGVPVAESQVLADYDSYYYAKDRESPLPVLRVKFEDPDKTWFYIDPGMSRVVGRFTRLGRVERWAFHGLHSLDFSFWYYNRPLWNFGMIALLLGGATSSGIGLFVGARRLVRNGKRIARST